MCFLLGCVVPLMPLLLTLLLLLRLLLLPRLGYSCCNYMLVLATIVTRLWWGLGGDDMSDHRPQRYSGLSCQLLGRIQRFPVAAID